MLKLNNDYTITSDANSYTLVRRVPIKDDEATRARLAGMGKTITRTHKEVPAGYYATLEEALAGYCRSVVRLKIEHDAVTLGEVKQLIADLKEEISAYRCSHE